MKWLPSVDLEMHSLDVIRDLGTYYYVLTVTFKTAHRDFFGKTQIFQC